MRHLPKNALIVDWDYFFHIDPSWDWGFTEHWSPIIGMAAWASRAMQYTEKELPCVDDNWKSFWHRFEFSEDCLVSVADSNKFALPCLRSRFGLLDDVGVWLFDQHHDCGYHGDLGKNLDNPTCENWMIPCGMDAVPPGSNLHVLYPVHRTEAFDDEPEPLLRIDRRFDRDLPAGYLPARFDYIFICRSGSWVPPWCDDQFVDFVRDCPVAVDWSGHDLFERPFVYPGQAHEMWLKAVADITEERAC